MSEARTFPRFSLRTLIIAVTVIGVVLAVWQYRQRALIKSGEVLEVTVVGTLLGQDIDGLFLVDESGKLPLGPAYGKVAVQGLRTEEAQSAITAHLKKTLHQPEVNVSRIGDNQLLLLQAENRKLKAEIQRLKAAVPSR
jgi:protein involved in polysaccharide export with SLBB domain